MKIYTRTGDQGKTSLFTGERVPKYNPIVETLGAVDEGNSAIGMAISFFPRDEHLQPTKTQLETIQHALFDAGAAIATPQQTASEKKLEKTRFDGHAIEQLEKWIDEMELKLPPIHYFILPGGHPAGAALHLARGLIRRAERSVATLYDQGSAPQDVLIYLNRLSDYLFVCARYVNHLLHVPETPWQHHIGHKDKKT